MQAIETYFKRRSEAQLFREFYEKRPSAARHALRVASLTGTMAQAMGYDGAKYAVLIKAALYHDIGKLLIPDAIINNPNSLSPSEFEIIKAHVHLGVQLICSRVSGEISQVVSQHHERIDGSGYPMGISGDGISELAKILAICDSYDAMVSYRVYQPQRSSAEACKELLRQADARFDGKLVRLFLDCLSTQKSTHENYGGHLENQPIQCSSYIKLYTNE